MWSLVRRPVSSDVVQEPADPDNPNNPNSVDRDPEPGRRIAWWIPALAVAVAFLAVLAAGLAQPGRTISGEVTGHYSLSEPRPPVADGQPYVSEVVATEDRLAAVSAVFATYMGSIRCSLDVHLTDRRSGQQIGSGHVDCADLADNTAFQVLSFPPVEDSAGRTFDLEIALAQGSSAGPSVWSTPDHHDALLAGYDPQSRMTGHLGEVLRRLAAYGPGWASPIGLVAILVFAAGAMVVLLARPRWGIAALLVLVLVRGLLWMALIPPLQGMDEGAHFASVQYIATEGRLPNRDGPDASRYAYSDSLVVASGGMHVSAFAPTDRPDYTAAAAAALTAADAKAGTESGSAGPAAGYPPGYYGPAALFYLASPGDTVSQVYAIRLWSAVLGLVAILLAWMFCREVFPRQRWAQVGLVVAVALQPMISHQFAIVNNDALVIVAGFGGLWMGARLTREARAGRLMLIAGIIVGLGLLGKPFAIGAAIPVAIGWLLGKIRYRVKGWRALVGEPALAALGVAATYGLWLAVAAMIGISTSNSFPVDHVAGASGVRSYLASQLDPSLAEFRELWINQYWGNFGWVDTPLPTTVQLAVWVFVRLIAVGVVVWLLVLPVRRFRTAGMAEIDRLIAVCVGFVVGMVALLYVIEFFYYKSSGQTNLLQGRYALMTVPALLALPGLLVARLSRGKVGSAIPMLVVTAGVFVLQAISVGIVVRHFYL